MAAVPTYDPSSSVSQSSITSYQAYINASNLTASGGSKVYGLGPYLKSANTLRTVQWAKGWLWDCKIPDAPAPFNTWFPGTDYSEDLFVPGEPKRIKIGARTYQIPGDRDCEEMSLTFIDNDQGVLQAWMEDWVDNTLYRENGTVATLSEGVKEFLFARLDGQRNYIQLRDMWIFPKDKIDVTFGSDDHASFIAFTLKCEIAALTKTNNPVSQSI